jgi:hypothetical protein
MYELIGFGYWRSLYEPSLPDPAWFVDASWTEEERRRVVAYLSQGRLLHSWMGFSWCRFRCGTSPGAMGASDLTDGTYCWPEGLIHYITKHSLRLPTELVQHILTQSVFPVEQAKQFSPRCEVNMDWWRIQKGWNSAAKSFLSETDQEVKDFVRRYDQNKLFLEDYTEDGRRAIIQITQELKSRLST